MASLLLLFIHSNSVGKINNWYLDELDHIAWPLAGFLNNIIRSHFGLYLKLMDIASRRDLKTVSVASISIQIVVCWYMYALNAVYQSTERKFNANYFIFF